MTIPLSQVQMGHLVSCYLCGIRFAFDTVVHSQRRDDGRDFYCPNGHKQSYCETAATRLQKKLEAKEHELQSEKKRTEWAHQDLKNEQRSHSATKGNVTKLKNRAAAGVCPCCKRTFKQLADHMKDKHPTFGGE